MKKVPLHVVHIVDRDGKLQGSLDYAKQLVGIVSQASVQGQGMDAAEIRKAMRVMDVIEAAASQEFVDLEDADYEFMRQKVLAAKFVVASREVMQFIDDVTGEIQHGDSRPGR